MKGTLQYLPDCSIYVAVPLKMQQKCRKIIIKEIMFEANGIYQGSSYIQKRPHSLGRSNSYLTSLSLDLGLCRGQVLGKATQEGFSWAQPLCDRTMQLCPKSSFNIGADPVLLRSCFCDFCGPALYFKN